MEKPIYSREREREREKTVGGESVWEEEEINKLNKINI